MYSILNKSKLKKFILQQWEKHRTWKMTRVSQDAIDHYEFVLRQKIIQDIQSHPSVGKTFKP